MLAFGYSYDKEKHFLFDDYMIPVLNCAYYRGELQGEERILSVFSLHEQGEIGTWTLLRMHKLILAESEAERERGLLRRFVNKECLQKLGIEPACQGQNK